jgi:hypothetical protein
VLINDPSCANCVDEIRPSLLGHSLLRAILMRERIPHSVHFSQALISGLVELKIKL